MRRVAHHSPKGASAPASRWDIQHIGAIASDPNVGFYIGIRDLATSIPVARHGPELELVLQTADEARDALDWPSRSETWEVVAHDDKDSWLHWRDAIKLFVQENFLFQITLLRLRRKPALSRGGPMRSSPPHTIGLLSEVLEWTGASQTAGYMMHPSQGGSFSAETFWLRHPRVHWNAKAGLST
jgi:hypothetical protein